MTQHHDPGESGERRMPEPVRRWIAEWSEHPDRPLPEVSRSEALARARAVIPYIEAASAGDCGLLAAIETSIELLLLAWGYLEVLDAGSEEEAG